MNALYRLALMLFLTLLFLQIAASVAFAQGKSSTSVAAEHFSHALLDSLLQSHVVGGRVLYAGFEGEAFRTYCKSLETIPSSTLKQWSRDEQLAFWLNAYNTCVIANVLAHPGIAMVANVRGFFDDDTVRVAEKNFTLQDMKDEIRLRFRNPLMFFGMTDGTKGSPKLAKRAFRAATVAKQLTAQAKSFLRSEQGAVLDVGTKTLRLARLFETYRGDFEASGQPLAMFVAQYLNDTEAAFVAVNRKELEIAFFDGDMRLNKRETSGDEAGVKPYQKQKKPSSGLVSIVRKKKR